MKIPFRIKILSFLFAQTLVFTSAFAEQDGSILIPDTTVEHPEHVGKKAHTNHMIFLPNKNNGASPAALSGGETSLSLTSVYNLTPGGSGIIVIVDAYHYPTADTDLQKYSTTNNLPQCTIANGCFSQVYATSTQPPINCGWNQEAALDIEMAHAMAPNAKIVLVEAASNSYADLFSAVDMGTNIIKNGGVNGILNGSGKGELSMSWGGSEFSLETFYDSHFKSPNVVYFASSGDTGGMTIYPSTSSYVVAAGGTTINRDSLGNFTSESTWSGSGGGKSAYERIPSYQNVISALVGSKRGVPDFSFNSNPASGVAVYGPSCGSSNVSQWMIFGGTSVAAPALAGIVNSVGSFNSGSLSELTTLYSSYNSTNYATDFRDITSGSAAGRNTPRTGWDFVTGIGSNLGMLGK